MNLVCGRDIKKFAILAVFLFLIHLLTPGVLAYTRTPSSDEVSDISIKYSPEIKIIEPTEGERIIWTSEGYMAKGAISSFDDISKIYLIVYPESTGQFWVQKPPTIFKDGTWEGEVFFGTEKSGSKEQYTLFAIVTDEPLKEGLIEKLPTQISIAKVGVYRPSDTEVSDPKVEIDNSEKVEYTDGDYTYILSGGRSSDTPIEVDDDLKVIVNGKIVFSDSDSVSTKDVRASWNGHPIKFSASYGDSVKIVAINSGGGEIELSPLYLHVKDESILLTKGVTKKEDGDYEFFSEAYRITIPSPPPPPPSKPELWILMAILLVSVSFAGTYRLKKRGKKPDDDPKAEEIETTLEEVGVVEQDDKVPETVETKELSKSQQLGPSDLSVTPRTFPSELNPRYTDVELIGKGGFGRVFKAKRKNDGMVVAIKIPISLDEATGDSFLKEIKAWEELKHPNIVKLYGRNILPIPYFEMEFMDGGGLEDIKKPLDLDETKKIVIGIAKGLKCAHMLGIIHRDLKPHNVLLTGEMEPKISDWGLSKVMTDSMTSSVLGFSPVYATPEQISPKQFGKTDERTDIWQLGVIFYELVTGKLPFTGESIVGVSNTILNDEPVPPSELNPEAKEVEDLILKCLAKKKEDRFKNINEFLCQLGVVKSGDGGKESLADQLKMTLSEQKEILKITNLPEEILKHKRMVVDTLGSLADIYAESGDKIGLLNALEDLKFYTIKNMVELSRAIGQLENLIKNEINVSEQFSSKIRNLVHKIRREYDLRTKGDKT